LNFHERLQVQRYIFFKSLNSIFELKQQLKSLENILTCIILFSIQLFFLPYIGIRHVRNCRDVELNEIFETVTKKHLEINLRNNKVLLFRTSHVDFYFNLLDLLLIFSFFLLAELYLFCRYGFTLNKDFVMFLMTEGFNGLLTSVHYGEGFLLVITIKTTLMHLFIYLARSLFFIFLGKNKKKATESVLTLVTVLCLTVFVEFFVIFPNYMHMIWIPDCQKVINGLLLTSCDLIGLFHYKYKICFLEYRVFCSLSPEHFYASLINLVNTNEYLISTHHIQFNTKASLFYNDMMHYEVLYYEIVGNIDVACSNKNIFAMRDYLSILKEMNDIMNYFIRTPNLIKLGEVSDVELDLLARSINKITLKVARIEGIDPEILYSDCVNEVIQYNQAYGIDTTPKPKSLIHDIMQYFGIFWKK